MKKKVIYSALRIGVTVALMLWILFGMVDPQQLKADLQNLVWGWLLFAIVAQAVGIYASILRWDLLLRGQGLIFPHRHLIGTFLIGRFFGTFLPSTIGLDAYRTYDVARRANATNAAIGVLVVEKAIGFLALALLVLFTLPAGSRFLPSGVLWMVCFTFCVPVIAAFLMLIEPWLFEYLLRIPFPFKSRIETPLRKTAEAVTIYHTRRRILGLAIMAGIFVHVGTTLMYFGTARALSAPVSLADMLFVGPIVILATVGLPSIGGEGVRELTSIGLLGRIGVSESSAFLIGHLGFWIGMGLSLAGGVIYLVRPASYQPAIRNLQQADEDLSAQAEDDTAASGAASPASQQSSVSADAII